MAGSRYPKLSDIYFWDSQFLPWQSERELRKAYDAFQRSMWKVRLTRWIHGKLDCEDWARLFVGHVLVRNALSNNSQPMALGLLTYDIDADPSKHHAICVAAVKTGDGHKLVEVEALPKGGITDLSIPELATVCRISF